MKIISTIEYLNDGSSIETFDVVPEAGNDVEQRFLKQLAVQIMQGEKAMDILDRM